MGLVCHPQEKWLVVRWSAGIAEDQEKAHRCSRGMLKKDWPKGPGGRLERSSPNAGPE